MASPSINQLSYLRADASSVVSGRWWRWMSVPFNAGFLSITGYRLSRSGYLAWGKRWQLIHTLLAPLKVVVRPFGAGLEIHYKADIGPGLKILHPTLGVIISGHATIGRNLVLTGGNCIGGRPGMVEAGGLTVGDGVNLGANAVILGPGVVGDGVTLGAGAVLIGDAPAGATMVGVPAREVAAASR